MIGLFILFILCILVWILIRFTKAIANPVKFDAHAKADADVSSLHKGLLIADMHADSLLYQNSLLVRSKQGHVDLPRLIEGNVSIQVFTCVSKFPLTANINRSGSGGLDLISAMAELQGWPPACLTSLTERAFFQAEKLHRVEKSSKEKLKIIKNQHDLLEFMDSRNNQSGKVAAILGLEGAHCLEGKLDNLDRLFKAGYRLMSPTHFFDNETGGSQHGISKGGLTSFGQDVIAKMLELNMIIDLAHASEQMMEDVLERVDRPVLVSHTGVKGLQ